jgi:hypothetical protein
VLMDKDECILYSREMEVKIQPPAVWSRPAGGFRSVFDDFWSDRRNGEKIPKRSRRNWRGKWAVRWTGL